MQVFGGGYLDSLPEDLQAPWKVPVYGQVPEAPSAALQRQLALERENEVLALEHARLANERMLLQNTQLMQENMILRMQNQQMTQGLGTPSPFPPNWWSDIRPPPAVPPVPSKDVRTVERPEKFKSKIGSALPKGAGKKTSADDTASHSSSSTRFGNESVLTDSTSTGAEEAAGLTTAMMRNIPNNYTRTMLLELIDSEGFSGQYDLVYLPMDFKNNVGLGYSFVNLVDTETAKRFQRHFSGFRDWKAQSDKVCEVTWSGAIQGIDAHIERYRNSAVMHESVLDECKPVLFKDGKRVPFPQPTKRIRAPRQLPRRP